MARDVRRLCLLRVVDRPVVAAASVAIFGAFSSYLASFERIIDEVFHHRSWFPFVFGGTAVLMGAASMTVGRSVERIGLGRLIRGALLGYAAAAVAMYSVSLAASGRPGDRPRHGLGSARSRSCRGTLIRWRVPCCSMSAMC